MTSGEERLTKGLDSLQHLPVQSDNSALQQRGQHFDIMAAMCKNRGIGHKGNLPWPFLPKEYAYYNKMTSSPHVKGKKCVCIEGRKTWDCTDEYQRSRDNVLNVVITRNPSLLPQESNLHYIASSFDDALDFCFTSSMAPNIDSVWVLGGQDIYEIAVNHPLCRRIYLTQIDQDLAADRFFPRFEELFQEIQVPEVAGEIIEECGIKYQSKVFQKITV